ncbi:hypothetical protein FHS18_004688 [Paenibacillus phyllosphaerae]|uniref:Transglutaminase-like domain-containing protein n=1 Tax=Paenibacillus phyllosphaerae TaxID=274593 RepID=A0A7W5FPV2_9BACL|nr:transglutaminase domain-containing protein [Paenibacillus phyllosphaerae]MBB3112587.1 hypothetical protein [Paenibacillus phyllosphaerae]
MDTPEQRTSGPGETVAAMQDQGTDAGNSAMNDKGMMGADKAASPQVGTAKAGTVPNKVKAAKGADKEGLNFFVPRARRLLTSLLLFGLIVEWLLPLQQLSGYTELYRIGPIIAAVGGFLAVGMIVPPVGVSLLLSSVITLLSVSLIYSGDSGSLLGAVIRIAEAVRSDAQGIARGVLMLSGETRTLLLLAGLGMMASAVQSLVWLRQWGLGITGLTVLYLLVLHSFLGVAVYAGVLRAIAEGLLLTGLLLAPRLERLFDVPLAGGSGSSSGQGSGSVTSTRGAAGWSLTWWMAAGGMTVMLLAAGLIAGIGKPSANAAAPWATEAVAWVQTHVTQESVTTAIRERSLAAIREPQGRSAGTYSWVGYGFDDTELGAPIKTKQSLLFTVKSDEPIYLRGESKSRYDGRGWLPEMQSLEVLEVGDSPPITASAEAAGIGGGEPLLVQGSGLDDVNRVNSAGVNSGSMGDVKDAGVSNDESILIGESGTSGASVIGAGSAAADSVMASAVYGSMTAEDRAVFVEQQLLAAGKAEAGSAGQAGLAQSQAVQEQGELTETLAQATEQVTLTQEPLERQARTESAQGSSAVGTAAGHMLEHTVTALQPQAGWPLLTAGADATILSMAEYGTGESFESYRKDPASGSIYAPTNAAVVDSYTVLTRMPDEDPELLREAGRNSDPEGIKQAYTELPDTLPERVRELADYAAEGGQGVRYDTVKAIESFLKSSYTYSRSNSAVPADGADFVDDFLFEQKQGYCVHFATAMVVMLRAEGIPARYVKGFAQGQPTTGSGGEQLYTVRASDAHAWVEVYFDGVGWVPFDPTPGITVASLAAADEGSGALGQGEAAGGAGRELAAAAGSAAAAGEAARAQSLAGRAAMLQAAAVRAAESAARGGIALAHGAAGAAAARPWAVAGLAAGAIAAAAWAAAAWRRRERDAFAGALRQYGSALSAGRHLAARGQFLALADQVWRELQERLGPRQAARTTREYAAALQLPPETAGLVAEFVRLDEQARYGAAWTQLPAADELARLLAALRTIGRK